MDYNSLIDNNKLLAQTLQATRKDVQILLDEKIRLQKENQDYKLHAMKKIKKKDEEIKNMQAKCFLVRQEMCALTRSYIKMGEWVDLVNNLLETIDYSNNTSYSDEESEEGNDTIYESLQTTNREHVDMELTKVVEAAQAAVHPESSDQSDNSDENLARTPSQAVAPPGDDDLANDDDENDNTMTYFVHQAVERGFPNRFNVDEKIDEESEESQTGNELTLTKLEEMVSEEGDNGEQLHDSRSDLFQTNIQLDIGENELDRSVRSPALQQPPAIIPKPNLASRRQLSTAHGRRSTTEPNSARGRRSATEPSAAARGRLSAIEVSPAMHGQLSAAEPSSAAHGRRSATEPSAAAHGRLSATELNSAASGRPSAHEPDSLGLLSSTETSSTAHSRVSGTCNEIVSCDKLLSSDKTRSVASKIGSFKKPGTKASNIFSGKPNKKPKSRSKNKVLLPNMSALEKSHSDVFDLSLNESIPVPSAISYGQFVQSKVRHLPSDKTEVNRPGQGNGKESKYKKTLTITEDEPSGSKQATMLKRRKTGFLSDELDNDVGSPKPAATKKKKKANFNVAENQYYSPLATPEQSKIDEIDFNVDHLVDAATVMTESVGGYRDGNNLQTDNSNALKKKDQEIIGKKAAEKNASGRKLSVPNIRRHAIIELDDLEDNVQATEDNVQANEDNLQATEDNLQAIEKSKVNENIEQLNVHSSKIDDNRKKKGTQQKRTTDVELIDIDQNAKKTVLPESGRGTNDETYGDGKINPTESDTNKMKAKAKQRVSKTERQSNQPEAENKESQENRNNNLERMAADAQVEEDKHSTILKDVNTVPEINVSPEFMVSRESLDSVGFNENRLSMRSSSSECGRKSGRRAAAAVVSYKEPNLMKKMRRVDPIGPAIAKKKT